MVQRILFQIAMFKVTFIFGLLFVHETVVGVEQCYQGQGAVTGTTTTCTASRWCIKVEGEK